MIDFHTHILPAIDDGAKDLEESFSLIDSLQNQGVFDVVLTPHFYPDTQSCDEFLNKRDNAYNALSLNYNSVRKSRLFLGAEVYCNEYLLIARDLEPLCINNTSYMLLELPFSAKWSSEIWQIIRKIFTRHGITPIIAHADRYPAVLKHPDSSLSKLIEEGCIIQFGCDSIADKFEFKKIFKCIESGKVHLLGSDCHNTTLRPPRMKQAIDIIESELGKSFVSRLENNAQLILNGKSLHKRNLFF